MTRGDRCPRPSFAWLALGVVLLYAAAPAAQPGSFLNTLLKQQRFSSADLRTLASGVAVVKSLDTPVRREIAHFGVVHIDAPADRFVDRFVDIERFEKGPGVPQIGRFSDPPRLADLASLTLPAEDVEAVATCHPRDCDMKLSTSAMAVFRKRVNASSPNAARQANEVLREMLLDLVRAYQANGNASLGNYDDGDEPVPVAAQFRALLTDGNAQPLPLPELMTYLETFPRNRPAGAEDFFYWSVVDFGLKPTVRVNHVVMYQLPATPSGVSHVIAIKQLYASHYFHTTLELRFLVEDERRAGGRGFDLVSITRSRIDGTSGLTGSLLRPIINRRSRNAVRGYLEHLKRQVERAVPASF